MGQPVAVTLFTLDELWLLQACIRHECPQADTWHNPPASLELNDQVAEAILFCVDCGEAEAALALTRGMLLAIDACVRADMKDAAGKPSGREILLKSFRARRELALGTLPEADEPAAPNVQEKMHEFLEGE